MHFDFSETNAGLRYKLMASAITPRPIAWITSQSADGVRNAAPFSFFNMMGASPPLLAIGMMRRPDGSLKDSAHNILETGEFVVNLVGEHDAAAMNLTSVDAPPDFDEIAAAGLSIAKSQQVAPPLIATAPVSMECRLVHQYQSGTTVVLLGEVLHFHIRDGLIAGESFRVDTPAMELIARMHGSGWYTRSNDRFLMERPKLEDFPPAN
jgi:flavin reductase (DIM6/NTAB) family NADH-FMN oxidoreductase RutF